MGLYTKFHPHKNAGITTGRIIHKEIQQNKC